MPTNHHQQQPSQSAVRGGFTIFELLLVLALLVIIGAVAVVGLSGSLSGQQLRSGGDEIRIAWTQARIAAMKSGRIHVFRYMPGERQYIVEKWIGESDLTEGTLEEELAPAAAVSGPAASTTGEADEASIRAATTGGEAGRLPKGVTFVDGSITETNRSLFAEEDAAGTGAAADGAWSPPVLFYPDGQTSDAYVVLRNEDERYVKVTLRSLTGASQVSETMTLEEIAQ